MIEVAAAAIGAAMGIVASGLSGMLRRDDQAAAAVIRLTSAVEHIATSLETLHTDIKETNREMFTRLNQVENRVTKLEVK